MRNRFFGFRKNSKGQVLVIVAVGMAVFLGFAAISVEYGYVAVQKRNIQNAADAAALAGAQVLYNTALAETTAVQVANNNKGNLTFDLFDVDPTTPYNSDPTKIEVEIDATVPGIFSRIWGNDSSEISARAVARQYWDGQALPLVNTGYIYTEEDMLLRINKTPGDKSQLFDFFTSEDEYGEKDYGVLYSDGIVLDQGNGNTKSEIDTSELKTIMEDLFKPAPAVGTTYYLFSLEESLIEGYLNEKNPIPVLVTDKNGNENVPRSAKNGGFKEGDILRPQDLVLLKVSFLSVKKSNQTELELRFIDEYDLSDITNLPKDFISTGSGYANLVE